MLGLRILSLVIGFFGHQAPLKLNDFVSIMFPLSEAGKIQVYVRVRPFTEREKEKREVNAIEIHQEHSLVS